LSKIDTDPWSLLRLIGHHCYARSSNTIKWQIIYPHTDANQYVVKYLWPVPLFVLSNTQNMHVKSIIHNISTMFSKKFTPWRRGIVVIASAYITEDPVFETRHAVRFLGVLTLQCCCRNLIRIVIVCIWEK
jgi:hypothetical protein